MPFLPQMGDKLCRAMRTVNDRGFYALDTFDKLVKVSVIGKGDGIIDAQSPAPIRVDGPAGNTDGDGPPQPSQCGCFLPPWRSDDDRVERRRSVARFQRTEIAAAAL